MHTNAGVYRNEDLLSDGCKKISQLADEMNNNLKVTKYMCIEGNYPLPLVEQAPLPAPYLCPDKLSPSVFLENPLI